MKLTIGFSPCPNDTFIFDALVNKKIDTAGLEFDPVLADVQTLNEWALEGKLDIIKLSFPAFFRSTEHYLLLNSGSALGKGVGPLLISGDKAAVEENEIKNYTIALPGENTTAHLLFSLAYPEAKNKLFMRFDRIEDFVLNASLTSAAIPNKDEELSKQAFPESAGVLGVIIHENRFTYLQKGLHKVKDLGEFWEEKMKSPVPLGGIAINQSVKRTAALTINKLIRSSIDFAFNNYPTIPDYVKQHSQSMSEEVMRQHINLYVNQYSLNLGEEGRRAIGKMYKLFQDLNKQEAESPDLLFL